MPETDQDQETLVAAFAFDGQGGVAPLGWGEVAATRAGEAAGPGFR